MDRMIGIGKIAGVGVEYKAKGLWKSPFGNLLCSF